MGFDCINGMAFPTGPMVLQENNTRLAFGTAGQFRLAANQSNNGGLSEFRIDSAVGPTNISVVNATTNVFISVNLPSAVEPGDGTLHVLIEELAPGIFPNTTPAALTDGNLAFTPGQIAVIPAGAWTRIGATDDFNIDGGTIITPLTAAGFDATYTNGFQSFVAFSETGNMVILGVGSQYEAGAVSVGNPAALRQVRGVADAVALDDLINVGQLQNVAAGPGLDLSAPIQSELTRLENVSAMTAAMSALQPNPRSQAPLSVSFGLGTYEGETAAAIGLLMRLSDAAHFQFGLAGSDQTTPQTSMSFRIIW